MAFVGLAAMAQNGIIRGFVYEKSTQVPVPFSNIQLKDTRMGTATNNSGFFQINNVAPGTYTLVVSFIGFETQEKEIQVKKGGIVTETFYLSEEYQMLDDVVINVARGEQKTKILTSVTTLSPKKIAEFSVGGDPDLIRAIQVLPGVITSGDQGGQLYIRGGAPIQNLVLLDGMIVYNPFHSIGFFSVFDTDILQSADIYTAGFGAQYGSRNSSVMDIRTRDGNRQRMAGNVYASTFMSKLLLETPLGQKNEKGLAPASMLVSAKTSLLPITAPIFYPYVESQFEGLPFSFTDVFAKVSTQSDNGSRAGLFGFYFTDAVDLGEGRSISWKSTGGGGDFKVIPPSSTTLIQGRFAVSNYEIISTELVNQPRRSNIAGFNGGLDFTYFVRQDDEIRYGLEMIGYATDYEFTNSVGLRGIQQQNTTELGAYAQYRFVSRRFLMEPGFRVHNYGSLGEISFEPRLGLKYNVNENFRLKASGGRYSQNLIAANSDRDVVNLFYGFLSSSPQNTVPSQFRGVPIETRIQAAWHGVTGFEVNIGKNLDLNVEGYYKRFFPITNVNRNKLYPDNPNYQDKPELLRTDFINEEGIAYGIDFLLKYTVRKYNIWATYSWSRVTRDDGIQVYSPFFDRRHNLNLVGSYYWGKNMLWEANVRWNFGSGFPFTPTQGYYPNLPFVDPVTGNPFIDYDYTAENGEQGILFGALNSKRLPSYHRLDFTVRRSFPMKGFQKLDIIAGATNMYNRQNIFYIDRITAQRINQLPFMWMLGFQYAF